MTGNDLRLVTLDLDGTLLPHDTVFAAILREHGLGREVAASDRDYLEGRTTLEQCFWEQWGWVQPLALSEMHRALRKAAWLPGIAEGVRLLQAAGLRVALLTDQPTTVTDFLGRWGLTDAIASPVTVRGGRQVSIDARFDKLANLRRRLSDWGLTESQVLHVGNGVNDVPVFRAVGSSIAAFAHADVAGHARLNLGEPADLVAVAQAILGLKR